MQFDPRDKPTIISNFQQILKKYQKGESITILEITKELIKIQNGNVNSIHAIAFQDTVENVLTEAGLIETTTRTEKVYTIVK